MRNLVLLLTLLANPAQAAITADDLRTLVLKRDFAGVDAALIIAHTEYNAARTPELERDLYNTFVLSDPAIQKFTEDWAQTQPENPRALTAKAWNLYAWGNLLRGERTVQNTSREAMEIQFQIHTAAFPLFEKASKLQPDLISASNGLLRLTATLHNTALIPLELERIMAIQPNRGSLMRAMVALAPQWGGQPEQVDLLCDRYAPMVSDVKAYTPEVCRIDAVYYGFFWPGDQREIARQNLMTTPNPILDYARHDDLMDGLLNPDEAVTALIKIRATRPLDLKEAQMLDQTRNEMRGISEAAAKFPEYASALKRELALGAAKVDRDPMNPEVVHSYISVKYDAEKYANHPITAADKADMIGRLHTALKVVPTDPRLWSELAQLTLQSDDIDSIARAEPYFQNAFYYSGYGMDELNDSIQPKVRMVQDQSKILQSRDIAGLTPEQLAKLDSVVHCPLVMQLSIAAAICQQTATPNNQCAQGAVGSKMILDRLKTRLATGTCNAVLAAGGRDAFGLPAKVDF